MELLVVRHALPVRIEGAESRLHPLASALGCRQAEALAGWLAPDAGAPVAPGGEQPPITAVVTSPLRRGGSRDRGTARRAGGHRARHHRGRCR